MKTMGAIESNQENNFEKYSKLFRLVKAEIGKVVIGQEEMIDLTTTPKRGGIKGDPKRVKFSATV